jgi:hypothetical protein
MARSMAEPVPTPEQQAATAELAAIMRDKAHPYHNPGTVDHLPAVERVHALTGAKLGPEQNRALIRFREEDDVGVLPPAPGAPPLPLEKSVLPGGAQWDRQLVAALGSAVVDAGLPGGTEHALLAVLAEAHGDGTLKGGTAERCAAELEAKHGAKETEALIDDAEQAAATWPALGSWLAKHNGFAHAGIIHFVANMWRRSRHARR